MRTGLLLGLVLACSPAMADSRRDFVIARGEVAEKSILKDYAGAKQAASRALKLASDDGERADIYRSLDHIASQTGDVPLMIETMEFQIPRHALRKTRSDRTRQYVAFLHTHKALEIEVARAREKLVNSPDDIVALGILAFSFGRAKSKEPEAAEFTKRFEAANLEVARKQAREAEERAPKLEENAAMGYASAAKPWADAEGPDRVRLLLKKASESPALKDPFLRQVHFENAGDAYCLIGEVEECVKMYEAAIKSDDLGLQQRRLTLKIAEVRAGKKPTP